MSENTPELQIISNRVLYEGFGTLRKVYVSDGRQELDQEVFDTGDAVAVFLYHPGRRVVLFVEQIRIATALNGNPGGRLLEVCAGWTEGGEPFEAAQREVQEETGYDVTELESAGCIYMSPGVHTQRLFLYAANYDGVTRSGEGGGLAAESEQLELIERSYDEVREMLYGGRITDAKTMLLVQWAISRGLI